MTEDLLVLRVQRVRRSEGWLLKYELYEGESKLMVCESQVESDPCKYFNNIIYHIERMYVEKKGSTDELRRMMKRRIAGIGASLADQILPLELQEKLLVSSENIDSRETAKSLQVVSDEPWIPWELLRLSGARRAGPHLSELFSMTRWSWNRGAPLCLPLDPMGLVFPDPSQSKLEKTKEEHNFICHLMKSRGKQAGYISARYNTLLENFAAGNLRGWHFGGHGVAENRDNPDFWALVLDEGELLTSSDLRTAGRGLARLRPLVFLNACHSARSGLSLNGSGGLAEAFLEAGAGAFIGSYWSVNDDRAQVFARSFYERFLGQGRTIGEAVREARIYLREEFPGDPAWLAYTVFAHPRASVAGESATAPPIERKHKIYLSPESESRERDSEHFFQAGREHLERGEYRQAAVSFKKSLGEGFAHQDVHYYLALSMLAGRRPRVVRLSDIRLIEEHLSYAISLQSGSCAHLLLALVKRDFFASKGMVVREPSVADLVKFFRRNPPGEEMQEELSRHARVDLIHDFM